MPKARKSSRKVPITSPAGPKGHPRSPSGTSNNPSATRALIRRFHVLIKRKAQLQELLKHVNSSDNHLKAKKELSVVKDEITELGGLEVYQRMSSIGQGHDRGGGSEKVFIEWLKGLGEIQTARDTKQRLRLLEVGALKHDNYISCSSWIENTPIDLHSRHPSIREQDFLRMDEGENRERWDLISLSLVVNFVPNPRDRGRMLRLAHSMLRPNGYLFLTLPLPCITNSRYLTAENLQQLMETLHFDQTRTRWREGGKMAYWLFQKTPVASGVDNTLFKKKAVVRTGNRNNFSILL